MTRRYGLKVIDPRNPGGPKVTVLVPGDLALGFYKHDSIAYWNLQTAKNVLEYPTLIFEGVRQYNEGGWCYVGRPRSWYTRPEKTSPFPEDKVYCVYVNAGLHVYHFRADYQDPDDPRYPLDWRNRFRRQVWAATS